MTLTERIARGEAAIATAKEQGQDVTVWQEHLEELKREAVMQELPPRAWIYDEIHDVAGNLRAFLICSEPLDDFIYLALDPEFEPSEPHPIYYPEELEFLKHKTPKLLAEIHQWKLTFGSRSIVRQ